MVFPTFFNFSLNLSIRSSWSEPQSTPGLVFADCIEPLHFGCKEYNQSDIGVDHLVMSMCRVFSCVIARGCLLWPVLSLDKTFISLGPASFRIPRPNLPVTPGVSWFPTFAFQSPKIAGGLKGATPCSRSGGVAVSRYPLSKVRRSICTLLEQPWRDTPLPR